MKYIAVFVGAGVALAAAVSAAFWIGRSTGTVVTPSPKPTTSVKPTPSISVKPSPPSPTPSLTPVPTAELLEQAKQVAQAYREVQADADAHPLGGAPVPTDQAAATRALSSKAMQAASKLAGDLRRSPAAWPALVEFLVTIDDVRVALKITERIRMGADASIESRAVGMLKAGQPVNARRIAASLLGARRSKETVEALAEVAGTDADAVLRLAAVNAIGDQLRRPGAPELSERMKEILKKSADTDADPAIREAAAKFLAGRPPGMNPPGRPPRPFPTPTKP